MRTDYDNAKNLSKSLDLCCVEPCKMSPFSVTVLLLEHVQAHLLLLMAKLR